jgi:hypothetical protein
MGVELWKVSSLFGLGLEVVFMKGTLKSRPEYLKSTLEYLKRRDVFEDLKNSIPVNEEFVVNFKDAVSGVKHVTVVYGAPGSGKTTKLADMLKRNEVPKPALVLAFNNSTAHWFENKVEGEGCVAVRTIDSVAVGFVGFGSMLMKTKGKKSSVGVVGGSDTANIELGVELRRLFVAKKVYGVNYSLDPFKIEPGNEIFGLFDYTVNKVGARGIKALVELLNKLVLGLGGVVDDYVKCLEGEVPKLVGLDGKVVKCKRKYDFTLARLELLDSVLPEVKVRKENCGRPRTLIVDEFQDMSPLMLGILGKWLSSADVEHFVVAGDFDQLIYRSLHHADLEIPRWLYQQAKVRDGWQVIELSYSHRVAKPLDALSIEFLNAHDDEPSPWRKWSGNKDKFGVLYIKSERDVLREIRQEIEKREDLRWGRVSYAILTPTNEVALSMSTKLLRVGILPHFLKGVPSDIANIVAWAGFVLSNYGGNVWKAYHLNMRNKRGVAKALEWLLMVEGVIKYAKLRLEDYASKGILNFLPGRENLSKEDALREVIENDLNPRNLTYAENPHAPVFVDTVYTAKGLEFERVYIANYSLKNTRVPRDKWGARLFYVALTRSKGSVTIIPPPDTDHGEWFPISELVRLAKKLGVEVIEK